MGDREGRVSLQETKNQTMSRRKYGVGRCKNGVRKINGEADTKYILFAIQPIPVQTRRVLASFLLGMENRQRRPR